jgi:molybdopterin synthase catalytic subunit
MQVTVRLFGSVRETTGAKELAVALPEGATVGDLRERLAREHPAVAAMGGRLRAAVNQEVASDAHPLAEGDEVALLPPVAGGQDVAHAGPLCTLSDLPLDVGAVVRRVTGPDAGGVVTFVGTVRDHARGRSIRHLEYEAYPGMAEREMEGIAEEAARQWPGARVAMAHRTGRLDVGEIAVVVAAAAPHRAEAFAAARYAIDTLKARVPIWKKEVAEDGEYWVEEHA